MGNRLGNLSIQKNLFIPLSSYVLVSQIDEISPCDGKRKLSNIHIYWWCLLTCAILLNKLLFLNENKQNMKETFEKKSISVFIIYYLWLKIGQVRNS